MKAWGRDRLVFLGWFEMVRGKGKATVLNVKRVFVHNYSAKGFAVSASH